MTDVTERELSGMADSDTGEFSLRRSGSLHVDDGALSVHRDEGVTVRGEDIRKVNLQVFRWGLATISAVAVLFGAYFAVVEHPLGGLAFSLVGAWSLWRSYRNRYALVVWVDGRPNPIAVYPEDPKGCHAAVAKLVRPDETPVTER